MNKRSTQIIVYLVAAIMLSISSIYFVTGYQQLTDEGGDGFHEIKGDSENLQATSDLDKSQWNEIDLGGKVQTIFFLAVGVVYIPLGIWMLKNKNNKKPYIITFAGSLSLIILYILSRTVDLPVVGLQGDVGTIDVMSKILQGGIVAGSSYLIMRMRKMENNPPHR
ncbi:MAG: hypothetical protein HY222_05395 [Thaumarchaeota archaeon]|nr:hypothetical protein [Nitrososphaerota archaeon]MBI3641811.1 hypothetical protein [Nitrososphaerota archaeon]